ncbi:OLC1v1021567C1 [Oldenlandia corymbosa var. corymbosa]|uniref:OLC1v1021567C1 n=1 Tax=Oldenlandia corymbosa var. corymbosa TaxID=529605 RepID=A0AAV1BVY7_OLDCO|nr:OLC1v1021567C1 [Oldenlandia corymbosa var. corymbosa]
MLAIFKNGLVEPPKELNSPASESQAASLMLAKVPEETLKDFMASHSNNGFSLGFADHALLAYAPPQRSISSADQRMFCGIDDIYCVFLGSLTNLWNLNKQYGLSKNSNEAMFVIEAYRTLRDRGPYPAHQVLKDLEGCFGFVIYDNKAGTVFVALGADEAIKFYWGISANGTVMISDNVNLVKASCAKSFAPFPAGCMYHSERGLMSFEHPMNKMKAMPRVDSEGIMCGATFKVDVLNKMHSMPRINQSKEVVVKESEEITTVPVSCYCGKASKLRTSWTDANPGRRFLCCKKYGRSSGCGFFQWYDKPMCEQSTWVIPSLLRNVRTQEAELTRHRQREKLLWFALVGSWISVLLIFIFLSEGGRREHQQSNEL